MKSDLLLLYEKRAAWIILSIFIALRIFRDTMFVKDLFSNVSFIFGTAMVVILALVFNIVFHLLHKTITIEKIDPVSKVKRIGVVLISLLFMVLANYSRLQKVITIE